MLELAGKSAALKRWLSENEAKKVDGARSLAPAAVQRDMLLREALSMG